MKIELVLALVVISLLLIIGIRRWANTRTFDLARDEALKVFPIWAAQGPFENGEESARAMRFAWLAVYSDSSMIDLPDPYFEKHASSFDEKPDAWEKNRQSSISNFNAGHDAYLKDAWRLRAADLLEKAALKWEYIEAVLTLGLELPFNTDEVEQTYKSKMVQKNDNIDLLSEARELCLQLATLAEKAGLVDEPQAPPD